MENKVKYRYPTPDEFVPGFKYQVKLNTVETAHLTTTTWEDRTWDMNGSTEKLLDYLAFNSIRVWEK